MEQAIFLTEKQMDKQMNSLTMTAREIFDVTGYKQPARQKRVFETLGVPVHIRPDGTVSVCRQHYLESHTHTQVQKRYAALIAEVDAPVGTMFKLLERWKNEALSKYALKTRKEYIRMTDIASKAFAEFDIEHVRPMHIAAFVDDNFIDKPNAANKYKALLSLVFSFAVRKGLRDDNPCRDIHGVPEPK